MGFDAGALFFKIQAVGAALFKQDMGQSKTAIEGVEGASKKAAKAADDQSKSTETLAQQTRRLQKEQAEQERLARDQAQTAKNLSLALIATGVAVAALVTLSVAKYVEFDKAMSNTSAAVMATTAEKKKLGDAALKAGADTAFSAKEAAEGEEELAKAGQTVAEIVGGSLNGALALAAAGQLEVARSAEIMATTLKVYRLPAEQAAHVSDLLSAAAGKAQGSVDDVSLALDYAGIGLAQFNVPLEESVGTLALFAANGILGEKAGTGLRGALAALTGPSAIGASTMKEYGVNVFDAQGKFIGMAGVAQQLRTAFAHLSEEERAAAMNRIFGNESMNVANVLYREGAAGVQEWTDKVNDAGYAADQAGKRQDNLAGDVEKLGGAFDTALIKTGAAANDVLRTMVQAVTELVDWYGELPEPVQNIALVVGVGTAALLLFAGAAIWTKVKFAEMKVQLDLTTGSIVRTGLVAGAAGIALTGVLAVVAVLAQKQAEARAKAEAYADALDNGAAAARNLTKENLQADTSLLWMNFGSAYDNAEKLGISLDLVTDAASGVPGAMKELNAILDVATGGGDEALQMADRLGISYLDLSQSAGTLRDSVKSETDAQERANVLREQSAKVTDENTDSTKAAAEVYLEAADGAGELKDQLAKLIDQINEANGVGQDAVSANIDYQDSLRELDAQVGKIAAGTEGYARTLDIATQAGSDNYELLLKTAEGGQQAAEAQFALDGNTQAYMASLQANRDKILQNAQDLGATDEQLQYISEHIVAMPSQKEVEIIAQTAAAEQALANIARTRYASVIATVYQTGTVVPRGQVQYTNADGGVYHFANGGTRNENHVAQIARAGDVRVWAEDETEGEGYVPFARSKRVRSEQIMQEIAGRLGGQYLTSSEVRSGDGVPAASTSATSTPRGDVNVTFVNSVVRDPMQDAYEAAQIIGGLG